MTNPVIPVEAVIAATKVLYSDKMSNHSGDNAPQIIDACEVVAKKILEAAAPYMLAGAWEQGHLAGSAGKILEDEYPHLELTTNPYRSAHE